MSDIVLPHNWSVREHQTPLMKALLPIPQGGQGLRRAVCVWHRRAGKDSSSLNFTAVAAHDVVATYWHMLPTAKQGRHVVWDAIDPRTGVRTIDQVWPEELRAGINNTEMKIELKNGSMWNVVGSDNYDRLVGANPFGVIFSEYSIADPAAWDYIRPILRENGGWAIFIYTSRGKNHGYDMYEMARKNKKWFAELLTIEDTVRQDGTPVVSQQDYQDELDDGMDLLLARQEYYCSFDAGLFGSYYTAEMKQAKYGEYPWNPRKPVHTFWDIGLDMTSIWFLQESEEGGSVNVIDYEGESNVAFYRWIKRLNEKPYNYAPFNMPHDFANRDWKEARSSADMANEMNVNYELVPNISLRQGMDSVKSFLPMCRFNLSTTTKGVDGLYNYRREYNEKLKIFLDRPVHDWASHPADGFRYASIAFPFGYSMQSSNRFRVVPAVRTANGARRKKAPRIARGN